MIETSETLLICDVCGKAAAPIHVDDIGTQWYRCENGHTTANPKRRHLDTVEAFQAKFIEAANNERQKLMDVLVPLSQDPNLEDRFRADLDRTVKNDKHVTSAVFHIALSAYLDPGNLALKGASGAGKSYGTTEALSYFPKEDVLLIGSQSPKVVSHDIGELMTGNDEPLNPDDAPTKPSKHDCEDQKEYFEALQSYKLEKKAWDEKLKNSYRLIRLSGKILVFLEPPSCETFNMLKCTLSHDAPRIAHKYVDDKGVVRTAVLEGWPATIFCGVDRKYLEEFATRVFTVTPNTHAHKIESANEVTNLKKSYPWEYDTDSTEKQAIKALIINIRDTVKKHNLKVINPFPKLYKDFPSDVARDMRDFSHFMQLTEAFTLFKLYQRPIITVGKQEYLVTTIEDVYAAKKLFDEIAETTRTGTDKRILDFYHTYVKKHVNGATLEVIAEEYNTDPQNKKNPLGDGTIRFWLKRLNRINWVQIKKGEVLSDKRRDTFYPLKDTPEEIAQTELTPKLSTSGYNQSKLDETTLKSQIEPDLAIILQNSLEAWLEKIGKDSQVIAVKMLKIGKDNPEELTFNELKQKILDTKTLHTEYPAKLIVSTPKTAIKVENSHETTLKSQIKPVSPNFSVSQETAPNLGVKKILKEAK